ncbi:MAG: hypothetical protein M1486_05890 [Gammaproteobacteria bacterium]|nr:hypothetical protein [Gammaproteobacteria bacterium]
MATDKSKTQLSLFDTIVKIEKSTSSVDELRVPIFAPISKLSGNSTMAKAFDENGGKRTVKTSWGSAEIRNVLLTQLHKDLLDCIMTHAIATKRLEKGGVALYFYLNDILNHYGDKGKNTNWLKEKLDELADVRLKYYRTDESGDDDMSDFRIFYKSAYSAKEKMYCVILDDTYVKLYETGVSLDYREELPKLLQIKSPVIKAIIRFFFSHNHSNMSLEQLLGTIGYPEQSKRSQQLLKKELFDNIDMFTGFGITYDSKKQMFYYHGNEKVTFLYPQNK